MTRPIVFVSYSHKDEREKDQFLAHLNILEENGFIELWIDERIPAGADWRIETDRAIEQAQVALLLITANFLSSKDVLNRVIPPLMNRYKNGDLIIFPVLARACSWETIDWLLELEMRPRNCKPIWQQPNYVDEALTRIVDDIVNVVTDGDFVSPFNKSRWRHLQHTCLKITKAKITTLENKYQSELYLQREELYQAFKEFLKSNKQGFVLIGQSGVGKSNFMLALQKELEREVEQSQLKQSHLNICVLMYDGATLEVEPSLTEVITKDFNEYSPLEQPLSNIWHEIKKINKQEYPFLLYIDALNENPKAKKLLEELDNLVQKKCWPWLKIVFSSRPETWKSIKRGVKLSERLYYRENANEKAGIIGEAFSYSFELKRFSGRELQKVYDQYQKKYELQTPYEYLTTELRDLLKDPLHLLLIATSHQKKPVSKQLNKTRLMQKYINMLVKEGLLEDEDLQLLEKQLMPLMIRENHYGNKITREEIEGEENDLCDAVLNTKKNQSFIRLIDTSILTKLESDLEQAITFKYERFYDYFGGKQLQQLANKKEISLETFYTDRIRDINKFPFLWGPVENALVYKLENNEKSHDLIRELSHTEEQIIKEMTVKVLAKYGKNNRTEVLKILAQFMEQRSPLFNKLDLLKRAYDNKKLNKDNAKKIALEVARILEMKDILRKGTLDSKVISRYAIQNICYLWDKNPEVVFEILNSLANGVRPPNYLLTLQRNIKTLKNISEITFYVFCRNYRFMTDSNQMDSVSQLQLVWKTIIATLLSYHSDRVWLWRPFWELLLSSFAIKLIPREVITSSKSPWNLSELDAFFASSDHKARLQRLMPLINPHISIDIEDLRDDLIQVAQSCSTLLAFITEQGLIIHHFHRGKNTLPLIRELFDISMKRSPPYICAGSMLHGAFTLADNLGNEVNEQALKCYRDMLVEYYDNVEGLFYEGCRGKYIATNLGGYAILYYRLYDNLEVDLLERYSNKIMKKKDIQLAQRLLYDIKGITADSRYLQLGLTALKRIVSIENQSIQKEIEILLAQLYTRDPDELDKFFEEIENSSRLKQRITSIEIKDTPDEMFRPHTLALQIEALRSPILWEELQWALKLTCECENSREYIATIIKKLINIVYGSSIFTIKDI